MWKQVSPQQPELSILARITADDIRPKVFSVLATMGFENAEDGVAGNFDDLSARVRAAVCILVFALSWLMSTVLRLLWHHRRRSAPYCVRCHDSLTPCTVESGLMSSCD